MEKMYRKYSMWPADCLFKPIGSTCGNTHELIVFMLARPNFTSIDLQNTTPNVSLRGWVGGSEAGPNWLLESETTFPPPPPPPLLDDLSAESGLLPINNPCSMFRGPRPAAHIHVRYTLY